MKEPRIAYVIILLFLPYFISAQSKTQSKKINFDNDWKFHLGHAADPAKDFNFKVAPIFSKSG